MSSKDDLTGGLENPLLTTVKPVYLVQLPANLVQEKKVNHILSDIFRENPWNPVYFRRQLFADIFCETKKYAIYFMRHLVIYFLRHQHIREDPFLNSQISTEQQESPSAFLQAYCRECVAVQCIVGECTEYSEAIQLLLRPKSTIQDSNKRGCVFPFPFPVWF